MIRTLLIGLASVMLVACVSQPLPEGFGDADDFDQVAAAKTRISLGLTYLKNGNYSQAKFNLDKALQFAPRLADAHYSMAYYYQLVGENELAEKSYQEAMDRAPSNPDIANTYGAFLCQQGKYEKAKKYFLQAVNSSNYAASAETFENLALCSQSQGQIADAINYLQSAINHQPSRAKSYLLMAQLQASQNQWQDAKASLRRYEKLARVTPETLWLSIKIERALGQTELARGYGEMLIRMYPAHPNTQAYLQQQAKSSKRARDEVSLVTSPAVKKEIKRMPQQDQPVVITMDTLKQAESTAASSVSTESVDTEVEKVSSQQQTADTPNAEQKQFHVVQKGENLYRISLMYNVKIDRLVEWNQLHNASSIYVGKTLRVAPPQVAE